MRHAVYIFFVVMSAIACSIPSLRADEAGSQEELSANLADLQITSDVSWKEGGGDDPQTTYLDISIIAKGSAAAAATACGDVELDSLTDENGQIVDLKNLTYRYGMILANHEDGSEIYPKDGVRISLDFDNPPPLKKLSEMRGSFALRTGGRLQEVVIADLLKYCGGDIDNEMLKKLGVTVRVARSTQPTKESGLPSFIVPAKPNDRIDELKLVILRDDNAVVRLEVTDSNGKPVELCASGSCSTSSIGSANFTCLDKFPDDSQLRLTIHRDAKKVRVPFVLKDVKIPAKKKLNLATWMLHKLFNAQSRPLLPVKFGKNSALAYVPNEQSGR